MRDEKKTKKELIKELSQLRSKIGKFERAKDEYIQTENILRANEKKYRSLVEVSSGFILELDPEGNYLFISPRVKDLLGYEPHEMLGKSALDFMPPLEAERVKKAYNEFVISKTKAFNLEHILLHKNGQEVIVESNGLSITDKTGNMLGYRGISRDITKRKQAEEAMRQQAFMIDQSYDSIISTDLYGNVTSWNEGAKKMFGYSADEALGKHISFIYPEDQLDFLEQEVIVPLKQKGKHETEVILRRKSGQNFYGLLALSLLKANDGTIIGMVGSAMDITVRKQTEEALSESEEKYHSLFLNSLEGIGISRENLVIDANPALLEIFGYDDLNEFKKIPLLDHVAPESRDLIMDIIRQDKQGDPFNSRFEYRIIRKDGETRDLEISLDKVKLKNEMYTISTFRDITDQKKADETLRESEEKYRAIVAAFDGLLYTCSQDCRIEFINQHYIDKLGFDPTGQLCYKALQNREDVCPWCASEKIHRGKTVRREVKSAIDGRWYYIANTPINHADGSVSKQSLIIDITERKRAQIRLLEEKKFIEVAVNALQDTLFVFDPVTGKAIRWNKAFNRISGYSDDEILSLKAPDSYYSEEDLKKAANIVDTVSREGIGTVELSLITKDGNQVPTEYTASIIKDQDDKSKYIIAIGRDITERKQAEKALLKSEERFHKAFHSSPDAISITTLKDGRIIEINERMTRDLGYSPEEIVGKNSIDLNLWYEPDDRVKFANMLKQDGKIRDHEFAFRTNSGDKRDCLLSAETIEMGGESCLVTVTRDITERKRAEKALRASESFNRAVIERSPLGVSVRSRMGKLLQYNEAWKRMWSKSDEKIKDDMTRERSELNFTETDHYLDEWQAKVRNIYERGGYLYIPEATHVNKKDCGELWVSQYFYAIKNKQGEVDRVVILTEDITERKKAEEALQQSHHMLEKAEKIADMGSWEWDLPSNQVTYSANALELYGIAPEEYDGNIETTFRVFHPEDLGMVKKNIEEMLAEKKPRMFEYRIVKPDGTIRNIGGTNRMYFDDNGKIIRLVGHIHDITERKLAEEELRRSECIVSSSHDMMALLDKNFIYLATNEAYLEPFGLNSDEVVGHSVSEVFGESFFNEIIKPNAEKCLAGKDVRYQEWFDFPVKGRRYMDVSYFPYKGTDNEIKGFAVNTKDITERKQAEESLQKSREALTRAQELAHLGNWEFEILSNVVTGSDEFYRIYGYQPEQIVLTREILKNHIHPDDLIKIESISEKTLNKNALDFEHRIIRPDGAVRYLWSRGQTEFDASGNLVRLIGTALDITERKQAEEALRSSEEQYRGIFDSSTDAIFVLDLKGRIVDANPETRKMYGYSREEFLELSPDQLIDKKDSHMFEEMIADFPSSGELKLETTNLKKDGSSFDVEVKITLFDYKGEPHYLNLVSDITERKQAEEALRESEEKYRAIVAAFDGQILICSQDYNIEYINQRYINQLGFDATGQPCYKAIHNLDEQCPWCNGDEIFKGKTTRMETKSNKDNRWYLNVNTPVYHVDGSVSKLSLQLDITDRKIAEEEKARLTNIIENTSDLVSTASVDSSLSYINRAGRNMLGWTKNEDINGKKISDIHPDWANQIIKNEGIPAAIEKGVWQGETALLGPGGEDIPVLQVIMSHKSPDGELEYFSTIMRDITERKQAEEALRDERDKAQKYLDIAGVMFVALNQNGNVSLINRKGCQILGHDEHEIIGKNWFDNFLPENMGDMVNSVYDKLMAGEQENVEYYENKVRTRDGQVKLIAWHNTILKDEQGNIIGTLSSGEDITERKEAEEALRERQEMISALIETSKDWIWSIDLEGIHTYCNPAIENILGYRPAELIGKNSFGLIHEDDRQLTRETVEKCIADNRGWSNLLIRWQHKDGSWRYLESNSVPIYNSKGEITGFRGVDRDVTERKQGEEELRKLAAVVKYSSELVNLATLEGNMIFLNQAGGIMLGLDPKDVNKVNIMEVIPDHLKELVVKELLPALINDGTWEGDLQYRNLKTGGLTDVHATTFAIKNPDTGEPQFLANVSLDITDRKRAENTLRESEERYRAIWENSPTGICLTDREGIYRYVNPAYCKIYGFSKEQLIDRPFYELIMRPEDLKDLKKKYIGNFDKGIPISTGEVEFIKSDGNPVWIQFTGDFVRDKGIPKYLVSMNIDITERKRAGKALRESEEKLRRILNSSPDAIIVMDLAGKIIDCNPATCLIHGHSQEELIGAKFVNLVSQPYKKPILEYCEKCIKTEHTSKIECILMKKDGSEFPADLSASVINDAAGKPQYIMGIIRELTEQKRLETQLIHSQKMESVGRLAGGVAHDFNNLLTAIIGHSEIIESGLKSSDPLLNDVKVIQQASERAAQLTSQLLAFSRKQTLQPKITNLNQVIDNMLNMLKRIIGEDIDFNILLGDILWTIKVDPGQMEQVIINLAVNARDAMETGGILTIETRNVEINDVLDQVESVNQSVRYVLLSVSDTGSGMSEEVRANIFEPFFTTKAVGKGTGLGLSTVYGIIRQSGGHIMTDSKPGAGTAFNIYLPAVEGRIAMVEIASDVSEILEGRETILIVEDDETVRGIAVETLKRIGYNVTEASSGGDALILCERMEKPVDLVITDVVMPNISGPEFIVKLKNIWPEFKMLYMSGYSDNDLIDQSAITYYLQKPFHPKALALKVRRVLDFQDQVSLNSVFNRKIDRD